MARPTKRSTKKSKKQRLDELEGNADPKTPIDGAAFLAHARSVLATLAKDLAKRAEESETTTAALKARWARDKEAGVTADAFPVYLSGFIDQVAASWLLACVFVRTLEDRGLLEKNRLAGPGAADSLAAFRRLAPYLNERDYLLTVFGELAEHPAARGIFDREHALFWQLGPSGEAARELLSLFTAGDPDTAEREAAPHYRFGQADTRLLGDLYQDLNESVRKRFALLQTPRFVESFILDRTLEPAIEHFGLGEVTVFDPTCGSGHFLLGAFDRLVEHRQRAEPARDPREIAELALAQLYGADLNPYAIAIARFRLILAYLDVAGFKKLADAPELELNLVVANSLLHNPKKLSLTLEQQLGVDAGSLLGERDPLTLDDPLLAKKVFAKGHAAVVGNPPYITEKNAALRDRYRERYTSAAGTFSLGAPFTEAFFDYGRPGAFVGMINANSFMKREFGKALIEKVLPGLDLTAIINTAGAYIPGHGTPTVLLFGRAQAPAEGSDVLTVLANRGEPSTPDDPEQGLVWRSIAEHWDEVGFENDYITVARTPRSELKTHPWSLAGGGATELKALLEERAEKTLGDIVDSIGFASFTGLDDVFILPRSVARTHGVEDDVIRPMVVGESVRDWAAAPEEVAVTPYAKDTHAPVPLATQSRWGRYLWPYRTTAKNISSFGGKTREQEGQNWWEWYRWQSERYAAPLRITFAFVATHNHFVLDRGDKVFNRSAPIIKLPEGATEDDHLALLAYLNSSTACFWMKQVCFPKGGSGIGRGIQDEEWESRFEFDGTKVSAIPLPPGWLELAPLARKMLGLEEERRICLPSTSSGAVVSPGDSDEEARIRRKQVALQERIDWEVYRLFGLTDSVPELPDEIRAGERVFEFLLRQSDPTTAWFERNRYVLPSGPVPRTLAEPILRSAELQLLERPEYKRRWGLADVPAQARRAGSEALAARLEQELASPHIRRADDLARSAVEDPDMGAAADSAALLANEAVPFLAAYRYTEPGMKKRALWEKTWELQRREDAGEDVGEIPVPPKYDQKDFRSADFYRLRGKLDVPKERFISYPGCESDEDGEPVYGWAGWDHLQRAMALWELYDNRKTQEGWPKERLAPILAGLLELLPWLHQWHSEPNADGFRMNDEFDKLLSAECHELGLTREELAAWRPPEKKKTRKRATKKTSTT